MIDKKYTYAVVGATNNEEKYGYKVLKDLADAGFKVLPINPKYDQVCGINAFNDLEEAQSQEKIDVVITIVPPKITETVVRKAHDLGIKNIWMQPGSESLVAEEFCKQNGMNLISNACIMIERK